MSEAGCLRDAKFQNLEVVGMSHIRRPIVETINGSGRTLTVKDSGKLFLLDSTDTCTINLPDTTATDYKPGELVFDFQVVTTNTNTYIIKRGTNGDILYGCVFCVSDTANKCIGVGNLATNDTLTIDSNEAAVPGAEPGSTIRIMSGGSVAKAWLITGHLFTTANTVTAANFSNT